MNTEALKEPTLLRNEVEPRSAQDSRLKKVPLNDLTLGNKCFNTPKIPRSTNQKRALD